MLVTGLVTGGNLRISAEVGQTFAYSVHVFGEVSSSLAAQSSLAPPPGAPTRATALQSRAQPPRLHPLARASTSYRSAPKSRSPPSLGSRRIPSRRSRAPRA